MAKVKDLGINVIPETMRPQECLPWTVGPVCLPGGITVQAEAAGAEAFSAATCIPNSCGVGAEAANFGWTVGGFGVPHCVGVTGPCTGLTYDLAAEAQAEVQPTVITICQHFTCGFVTCGWHSCGWLTCNFGTITNCGIITTCNFHTICPGGTCPGGSICAAATHTITIATITPQINPAGGGLTRESIAQLKEQLQQQIDALDEHAKTIGPKTSDEIDAREKQLKSELDDLAARRKSLKK
ncbi:MAG: hypothetical protein JWO56_1576 [Acidobacteria bacterium]|nr:hypothetical protein [Acidobacteriota bacterium]